MDVQPPKHPEVPAAQAGPKRILLIEDDDTTAEIYTMRLGAEGYEIKRAPDGESGLAIAKDFRPDLIILDMIMPKIQGFDVLDNLRSMPEVTDSKIIVLTALGQDADIQRARFLGVDEYLIKSHVTITDVMAAVAKLLS
ncbi:response regulator [Candidatus Saccharibacteria bacterium]|jgi:DNA-binding response OmpR family regulator|nr:response regulator [Candidatus Saccharibacteria bacterium]